MKKKQKSGRFSIYWIYVLVLTGVCLVYLFPVKSGGMQEITWEQFRKDMLRDYDVRGPHYFFQIGSAEVFEHHLEESQADFPDKDKILVDYVNSDKSGWPFLLTWIIPIGLLAFFWLFSARRISSLPGSIGKSAFDFGKSSPEVYERGVNNQVSFKDVAGYEEAKTEVMEIVEFLKHPEYFTKLGAKIPRGVLLVGASGTGKTLMAKAVAGEAGVPFFSLSGSAFMEMFVVVGASRVRDLFNKAKQKAPSILFIDEIDTIGRVRGRGLSMQSNDERESTLNQLLAEMDGFGPNAGVIVLAATNRADILDPVLLRPGRFDRHIYLDLPNYQERLAIFNVHLKFLLLDKMLDIDNMARQTSGFSGADIANVCNEAALIAARRKAVSIEYKDFSDAMDRVVTGLEKKSKLISPAEKNIIAYHEAGHALVSWMLESVDPLQKVSIIPRGKSLGGAWFLPEERQSITRKQFFERLCSALGGRAAEELVFNEVSSGGLDDLERVTKQAYLMVSQLGLNETIGNVSYYDSTGGYENSFQKPYSEATGKLIDEEVRKLVEGAYESTKLIIEKKRSKLKDLAERLLRQEVIYRKEIEQILGKRIVDSDYELANENSSYPVKH